MKILQVIDTLNVGGAEKMCVQLANLMKENGHEVNLLYFVHNESNLVSQIDKSIKLHFIRKEILNPFFYFKIFKILKKFDIVHVHMRGSIKVVYIATFFGYLFKSVIFHDHTGGNDQFLESSKGYLIYNAVRKFKYVAVYKQLCEKSTMKFNLNPSSTSIISNFVTFPNEKKLINNNFDLNNLEILVVGNFRKQKNQDFLILLSHELKKKNNIKFCFHLIGEIQKKTYYLNFINRVKKDKLSSHFKIYNNNNNIFNFDKGINLALMPSIEESGPLVLIEYLILNIPFLAHDVGDVTNIIKKYIPNQVINNLDAKEWVERLLEVNFDDNLAKYSNIYIREFSKEIAYEKWLNAYKSVVV